MRKGKMDKMDCKHCVYGKRMASGTYQTLSNVTVVQNGNNNWMCTTNVKEMSINGGEILCSAFSEAIMAEETVE